MLCLNTEEKARCKIVQVMHTGSEISGESVGLLEVAVSEGDQEPDAGKDHPRHKEAGHKRKQSVSEKLTVTS
jgi:hypothetical protein